MKNLTFILYLGFIGFLTSLFSSELPKMEAIKPSKAIEVEHKLLINTNRLEKDKFKRNSESLKISLDSLKNK